MADRNRFLLTGHSGFTGRYILEAANRLGIEVFCLTSDGTPDGKSIDLLDYMEVNTAVKEIAPSSIIHLAAISHVQHSPACDFYAINVAGTRNLVEAVSNLKVSPQSCVFASTANLYRSKDGECLSEKSDLCPVNDYAMSKKCMEEMLSLWSAKLPIIITRPFNYTGIGQSENFLIPKIVKHFRELQPVIHLGNLEVSRDFSDVRFIAEAYLRLASIKPDNITLNLCSGISTSIREIVNICSEITGFSPEIVSNKEFRRDNEILSLRGDQTLMQKTLGFKSSYSLRETLRWMINYRD